MPTQPRPAGYHCAKALRELGLESGAIASSLRRRLALDTGEIEVVLACPVTPPDGVPLIERRELIDNDPEAGLDHPRRRHGDIDLTTDRVGSELD